LESHPPQDKLHQFQKSQEYKDIIKHLKNEGATSEDIDAMVLPAVEDPGMVLCFLITACHSLIVSRTVDM
jgi:hypothetical protein